MAQPNERLHHVDELMDVSAAHHFLSQYVTIAEKHPPEDVESFRQLAGSQGVQLPRALSSLIFHFGAPSRYPGVRQLQSPQSPWMLSAEARRNPGYSELTIIATKSKFRVGPSNVRGLVFYNDDPATGWTKETNSARESIHSIRDLELRLESPSNGTGSNRGQEFMQVNKSAAASEVLKGFLRVSSQLTRALLVAVQPRS